MTRPLDPGRLDVESVPVSFSCLGCGQGLLSGAVAELKRSRPGSMVKIGVNGWCQSAKRCMWSLPVVIDPPVFDDFSGFGQVAEDVFV